MGPLGFSLASLVVMVAILSLFGAVRKEQQPLPTSKSSVRRSVGSRDLEHTAAQAQIALQDAQKQISTLSQQLEQVNQEKASLMQSLQQSQAELSNRITAVEALEQQLSTVTQEKVTLEEAIQLSQSLVTALQQQIASLSQENKTLKTSTRDSQTGLINPSESLDAELLDPKSESLDSEENLAEFEQSIWDDSASEARSIEINIASVEAHGEIVDEAVNIANNLTSDTFTPEDIALVQSLGLETATTEEVDPGEASGLELRPQQQHHPKESPGFQATAIDLTGKSLVMTGTLNHLSPNEFREKVEAAGGRVQSNPNSRTDYIVVGDNPGSKLQKAEKYDVVPISEAQLLEILSKTAIDPE
jgi:NAD-dependent DNA ligase